MNIKLYNKNSGFSCCQVDPAIITPDEQQKLKASLVGKGRGRGRGKKSGETDAADGGESNSVRGGGRGKGKGRGKGTKKLPEPVEDAAEPAKAGKGSRKPLPHDDVALPSEGDEKPPRGVKRSLASSFHSAKSASHDGVATTTKASKKLEGDRSTDDANSTRAGSRVSKKAAGPSNGRASKASNGSKNDAAGKAKGVGCPKCRMSKTGCSRCRASDYVPGGKRGRPSKKRST